METKLDLKAEINGNSIVVTNLNGDAAAPEQLTSVKITGNIESTKNYLTKIGEDLRKRFDPVSSCIKVSESSIIFFGNVNKNFSHTIEGKIEINPLIKKIGINSNEMFTVKDLEKNLRFMKHLFQSDAEWSNALTRIREVSIKTEGKVEATVKHGDKKSLIEQRHDFKEINFTILIPLFLGDQAPKSFPVSIYADLTDAGAKFWFEAIDLEGLVNKISQERISEQIKALMEFDFPIIYS